MDKVHLEHHLTLMDKVEHRGIASWRETEAEREEQLDNEWYAATVCSIPSCIYMYKSFGSWKIH